MYMLICCAEREIGNPLLYETKEEARHAMCDDMANVLGVPSTDLYESYLSGEEFDDGTCLLEDSAYTEKYGKNYDWKIFAAPASSGNPIEAAHGKWRFCGDDGFESAYVCSECGKIAKDDSPFCPNCGAKMDAAM